MQAFVITLTQIEESVAASKRAINSAARHGINAQVFEAITRDDSMERLQLENLACRTEHNKHGDFLAVVGCFMSHYLLWKKCVEIDEPIIILEHDAIIYSDVPFDLLKNSELANIGNPSFGRNNKIKLKWINKLKHKISGKSVIQDLYSKKYMPGCHGYYIEPIGAKKLIQGAKDFNICAADIFINKNDFPFIKEIYPWVVKVETDFSTIQHADGVARQKSFKKACDEKRNYKTASSFWEDK